MKPIIRQTKMWTSSSVQCAIFGCLHLVYVVCLLLKDAFYLFTFHSAWMFLKVGKASCLLYCMPYLEFHINLVVLDVYIDCALAPAVVLVRRMLLISSICSQMCLISQCSGIFLYHKRPNCPRKICCCFVCEADEMPLPSNFCLIKSNKMIKIFSSSFDWQFSFTFTLGVFIFFCLR